MPHVTSAPTSTTPPSSPAEPLAGTIIQKTVATGLDHPATFVLDKTGAIY
ncbi:MAG TPA: hypothetical protein VHW68_09640 [Actinomycetota bacterium]|jgi:hypothetical protein|nr:hypothetical protein [Actinomycetota bacterium]